MLGDNVNFLDLEMSATCLVMTTGCSRPGLTRASPGKPGRSETACGDDLAVTVQSASSISKLIKGQKSSSLCILAEKK